MRAHLARSFPEAFERLFPGRAYAFSDQSNRASETTTGIIKRNRLRGNYKEYKFNSVTFTVPVGASKMGARAWGCFGA